MADEWQDNLIDHIRERVAKLALEEMEKYKDSVEFMSSFTTGVLLGLLTVGDGFYPTAEGRRDYLESIETGLPGIRRQLDHYNKRKA